MRWLMLALCAVCLPLAWNWYRYELRRLDRRRVPSWWWDCARDAADPAREGRR